MASASSRGFLRTEFENAFSKTGSRASRSGFGLRRTDCDRQCLRQIGGTFYGVGDPIVQGRQLLQFRANEQLA